MTINPDKIYNHLAAIYNAIYENINIVTFQRHLPYEYWDLDTLFLEQTIYLEKVENKKWELEEIASVMMLTKTSETIKEYNNVKSELKENENILTVIESFINARIM